MTFAIKGEGGVSSKGNKNLFEIIFQELNKIFNQSKTKLKFKLHCIMPIDSLDEEGLSLKELLQKYNEQGEILFPILSILKSYPI